MEIRPVSPACGAEALGVDLRRLTDSQFADLHQAWLVADGVLVLRDQTIDPDEHIAFSRRFGELENLAKSAVGKYMLPGKPEIFRVSNKVVNGEPAGREDAGTYWHSDASWQVKPLSASLLYAIEIPPVGGDTMFANMYRAYDTLSKPLQDFLGTLDARHAVANAAKTSYARELAAKPSAMTDQQAVHPVVRVHPETGRKVLFVNEGFTSEIVGLAPAESRALLSLLFEHSTRAERIYRHRWQLHDLVIWDNRAVLHYAVSDYKGIGWRYMHRTSVQGEACR